MSEHHASVRWKRTSADFTYDTYNRAHEVSFNEGAIVVPSELGLWPRKLAIVHISRGAYLTAPVKVP
jgi:hypothetical protein